MSPLVTQETLHQVFSDIKKIVFHEFKDRPGARFAEIDFRSSKGVTDAMELNDIPVMGVPITISMMNPNEDLTVRTMCDDRSWMSIYKADRTWHNPHTNESGVYTINDSVKAPTRFEVQQDNLLICPVTGESESNILARTICLQDIDPETTENDLNKLFGSFSLIKRTKFETSSENMRYCLVEFSTAEEAQKCLNLTGIKFRGQKVKISGALTTVIPCQPGLPSHKPAPSGSERSKREKETCEDPRTIQALEVAEVIGRRLGDALRERSDDAKLALEGAVESVPTEVEEEPKWDFTKALEEKRKHEAELDEELYALLNDF